MKHQEMKFLQRAPHVIKYVCLVALIFLAFIQKAHSQDVERQAYYAVIANIIGQDTVVKDFTHKILDNKIKEGKITPRDSAEYVQKIRERELVLDKHIPNSYIRRVFHENLVQSKKGKNTMLFNAFERHGINLEQILGKIPNDSLHNPVSLKPGIKLLEEARRSKYSHSFSSPIEIGNNKFLVYHSYYGGANLFRDNYFIYSIDENGNFKDLTWVYGYHS
ncbi:hypothetical protein [Flagellimonas marina]|uniref:Uncharacterized protein n=1 Tax=Flagellimonas marina TaxID=1775168 RepID=A0ABV8PQX7_9FLAO